MIHRELRIRKKILIGTGIFALLVLLSQPVVGNTLLVILFLGVIPGTSIVIPAWVLFFGSLIGIIAALRWISSQPLYIGSQEYQEKVARQLARKKVLELTATPVTAITTAPVRVPRINAANRRRVVKA